MSSLIPRFLTLSLLLLTLCAVATAQVVSTDNFETNNVGDFPAGWTQVSGSVGYALITDSPVFEGTRAVRLSSGLSTASTIKITTAITNDFVYAYYVLIPDTGLVNETIGSVKVENVGMNFALGATPSEGIIYFSNMADGWVVPTNVYHHVKVEVDYQKNVLRTTVNGLTSKKYPASINTSLDLRLEATSISSVLQKHIVYVDSVSASLVAVDLTPAYVLLSNPVNGATDQGATTAPNFSWTAVSLATGYTLQIGTDSTFAGGIVYDDTTITTTNKSVPLPPLSVATTYYWRVRAKNTIGWGDWSLVRMFRTVDPPSAPAIYNPVDGQAFTTTDQIYFSFSTPSTTQSFQFQVAEDSLFTTIVESDSATSANSWRYVTFPPLHPLARYYWRVRAFGTAGWGAWSAPYDFLTPQLLPPPTLSGPVNGFVSTDLNNVYLYWSGVSGASYYWLTIAKDSGFTVVVSSDSTLTSTGAYRYFPPLEYNTTYYWKVRTGGPAGWGSYSGFRTFKTKPAPAATHSSPSNGSVESGTNIYLSVSTTFAENADSFRVQIALDTLFTNIAVDATDDVTGFSLEMSLFSPGTTYYWRVMAHNVAGWGPFSGRRTFSVAAPPVAPTLSSPANNAVLTDLPFYFTWSSGGATNVQDFRLQIATDTLFLSIVLDTVFTYGSQNIGTPPLHVDTRYYWRVRTRTYVGSGAYSTRRTFLTPQRPSAPTVIAPASGTLDLFGNVIVRWQGTGPKDSSHIRVTRDTASHATRVLLRTAGLLTHDESDYLHVGAYYNNQAQLTLHFETATNGVIRISGQNFEDPLLVNAGQQIFIQVQDFNEAGASDWCPWVPCSVLRTPSVPTNCEPVNGATGVPFINTPFSVDPSLVANTSMNLTIASTSDLTGIIARQRMFQESGSGSNRLFAYGPVLNENTTYYFQVTAFNGAGITVGPVNSFTTAHPAPVLTCVMDVPNDQGGQIDVDFLASALDLSLAHPATASANAPQQLFVETYSGWVVHDEGTTPGYRVAEIKRETEKLPEAIRNAMASFRTNYLWEPVFIFPAIGEDHYRVMVKSRSDSGKHGPAWEKFIVIAHASTGHQFRSEPDSGYSVDNLAPAPPVGGDAAVADGQVRVTWVANDEADLKEYVIYRSLNANDPVASLTPIGTTTETTFLDPSPPAVAVAYYYVVARDKNENDGEPAIILATIVTGVEALEGVPTEFVLGQNYPNPFNPTTTLRFGVPERSSVRLQVINTLGQVVDELIDAELPAGYFQSVWSAKVPSGLYFARMVATPMDAPEKRFYSIKKMVLLR